MNIKIIPFSVKLISHTDNMIPVWVKSRDQFLSIEGDKVFDSTKNEYHLISDFKRDLIKMDISISYFDHITLEVTSSLLTRDLFYSFYGIIDGEWAKTHRLGNPTELTASDDIYDSDIDDKFYSIYQSWIDKFESGEETNFDTCRDYRPLTFSTTWMMTLCTKNLIKILSKIKQYLPESYSSKIISEFSKIPTIKDFLINIDRYTREDARIPTLLSNVNSPILDTEIGSILYSQFIRHEGMRVSGILEFANEVLSGKKRSSNDLIHIKVESTEARLKEILKLRTSWFAMTDNIHSKNTWGYFLENILTGDLEKDKPYLYYFDSEGNLDKSKITQFSIDDNLRIRKEGKSKLAYLPDAIALESRDLVIERIEKFGNSKLNQDYLQMFDKGYIKDNPTNPLRLQWESTKEK